MKRTTALASILLATASLTASAGAQAPASSGADFAARCEALAGQVVGDVAITAATPYMQTRTLPAGPGGRTGQMAPHCLVEGTINQRVGAGGVQYGIGFELALPVDWQGRFLLMGGGGLNGSIRPPSGPVAAGTRDALSRGFAVASHDSGHKGSGFDTSFHADQRASLDFAETSVLTVTLATRALAERFYGTAPHHSYMTGCSTGGREGMLASQRYPELFDGIVIGAPAMRPGHSNLAIERAQVLLNATQPEINAGPAGITPAERLVVDRELARQCDGLDGREDGMIFNVSGCRDFDPSALACRAGETGDSCIAPERVEALAQAFTGAPFYAPIPWDTGITFSGAGLPGYLPVGQPGVFGPANASREMDVAERINALGWDAVGRLTDTAYWTNLSTYLGRGSKLMYFHGVSDPWFSAFDTWDYFNRAREDNGTAAWDDAARFYMVPGMMHCNGGNAFEQIDLLEPIVEWAENGTVPAGLTAARTDGTAGERPLCPHPQYPRYKGGDVDAAASYECIAP